MEHVTKRARSDSPKDENWQHNKDFVDLYLASMFCPTERQKLTMDNDGVTIAQFCGSHPKKKDFGTRVEEARKKLRGCCKDKKQKDLIDDARLMLMYENCVQICLKTDQEMRKVDKTGLKRFDGIPSYDVKVMVKEKVRVVPDILDSWVEMKFNQDFLEEVSRRTGEWICIPVGSRSCKKKTLVEQTKNDEERLRKLEQGVESDSDSTYATDGSNKNLVCHHKPDCKRKYTKYILLGYNDLPAPKFNNNQYWDFLMYVFDDPKTCDLFRKCIAAHPLQMQSLSKDQMKDNNHFMG